MCRFRGYLPRRLTSPIAHVGRLVTKMPRGKYYSPRLQRELISPLYHAAKAEGIPMTALASRLVADGLRHMVEESEPVCVVAEDPPEIDPTERV